MKGVHCLLLLVVLCIINAEIPALEREFLCKFSETTNVRQIYFYWTCENTNNACLWNGPIHCNEQEDSIVFLRINEELLQGELPSEIGYLSNLEYLDLANTRLTGQIPPQIGQLSQLQILNLERTFLFGSLPNTITQLSKLEEVFFPLTLVSTIPENIGQLSNLRSLLLFGNFYGTIPNSLGQLTDLEFLYIGDSKLTGTLPSTINQLKKLHLLTLYNTQLSGSIPNGFADLSSLDTLIIESTSLTGFVQLSSFPKLRFISITGKSTPIDLCGCFHQDPSKCSLANVNFSCNCTLPHSCGSVPCSDHTCSLP
jgi:hypothetical protein